MKEIIIKLNQERKTEISAYELASDEIIESRVYETNDTNYDWY